MEKQMVKASPLIGLAAKFYIEPDKLLSVLRGTVIKPAKDGTPATNEEIAAFCIVAQQYGLNPFTREIHAFTSKEKGVVPIVGIDGWTHIVNASGAFDGCEFDEVGQDEGPLPKTITCRMYVKGRTHPVCATERYSECYRNTPPWNTMPWRLLRHKAYMQAARYAFGLSGIYDEDEARDIVRNADKPPVAMPRAIDDPLPLSDGPAQQQTAKQSNGDPETAEVPTDPPAPTKEETADRELELLKQIESDKIKALGDITDIAEFADRFNALFNSMQATCQAKYKSKLRQLYKGAADQLNLVADRTVKAFVPKSKKETVPG